MYIRRLSIHIFTALLLISLLLTLNPATAHAYYEAADGAIKIYFLPGDGGKAINDIINLIRSSKHYVYVAIYDMEDMDIAQALLDAYRRGVDVRIVSDLDTFYDGKSAINLLREKGIPIVMDDRYQDYMHNKFIVIDNETVVTGSANFNERSFLRYNNNVVVIHSRAVALNYYYEFMEMYSGVFGGGNTTKHPGTWVGGVYVETYFAPEDDVASHIISLLGKANKTIYFAAFAFTHWGIAKALAGAAARGVEVKGVIESWNAERGDTAKVYQYLSSHNVSVAMDTNKYIMHLKMFIIDNTTVITGSFNPTYHAQLSNDENIVVMYSPSIGAAYAHWFLTALYPHPRIYVMVRDSSGNPVAGARVTAEDLVSHTVAEAVTNSSGVAVIVPREQWSIGNTIRITVTTDNPLGPRAMTTVELGPQATWVNVTLEETGWLNEKTAAVITAFIAIAAPLLYDRLRKHR